MKKDGLIYTFIFVVLFAFLFVFLLSLANSATAEQVKLNEEEKEYKALFAVLGLADSNSARKELFPEGLPEYPLNLENDGRSIWINRFSGKGLWGTINGILAIDSDSSRIAGLALLSHSETPGLGGRIDEPWFKTQFSGEKIGSVGIRLKKGTGTGDPDPDNSEVDAVTGASLTSAAVEVIVNDQIHMWKTGGEK